MKAGRLRSRQTYFPRSNLASENLQEKYRNAAYWHTNDCNMLTNKWLQHVDKQMFAACWQTNDCNVLTNKWLQHVDKKMIAECWQTNGCSMLTKKIIAACWPASRRRRSWLPEGIRLHSSCYCWQERLGKFDKVSCTLTTLTFYRHVLFYHWQLQAKTTIQTAWHGWMGTRARTLMWWPTFTGELGQKYCDCGLHGVKMAKIFQRLRSQ